MIREIHDPKIDVEAGDGDIEINQPQDGMVENCDGLYWETKITLEYKKEPKSWYELIKKKCMLNLK